MAKKQSKKHKKTGVKTRKILYAEAAKYAPRAIEVLVHLMESAKQESVRIAAAKTLLAKALPDIKMLEISGDVERPLGVVILPKLNEDNQLATPSRTADRSPKEN